MHQQTRRLILLLLLITLSIPQQVSAERGEVDQETRNRLMLQYGLDEPTTPNKLQQLIVFWTDGDFGYSIGAHEVYDLVNLVLYPLPWISRQLPTIVYILKMPFIQP